MKRTIIYICIAIAAAITLCGCGGANHKSNESKEHIFVSITPLRPLVESIVGDDFDISVLVPAGASPESFEPTPRQFLALNRAKWVFAVGLIDFEHNILSKIEQKEKITDLSHGIELIAGSCSHTHIGCNHKHHAHHTHGIDPHIWTSPIALKRMAENAYNTIAAAYPDSVKYKTNYKLLTIQLDSLDNTVRTLCEGARTRQFIIYHPALTYLARDYGLEQIAVEHEGKEPSAKHLAHIIEQAHAEGIKHILYQSEFPASSVEIICRDANATAVEINPLDENIFDNIRYISALITE